MSKFRQAAEELVRIMPELLRDGTLNNADTIEAKLIQFIGTNVGCIYCGASYDLKTQTEALTDHIMTCEKNPMVQHCYNVTKASSEFMAKVEELIKEKSISVENLTRTQLADAIMQAISCGDFQRHLVRGEDRQQVVYIPFQREHELKQKVLSLCDVVEANHKWHQEYDEHGGYPDSELCNKNVDALKERMGL